MSAKKKWHEELTPEQLQKVVAGEVSLPEIVGREEVLAPEIIAYAVHLGYLLFGQGQYRDAELQFLGLRMAEPKNPFHASALGTIYVAEQRYEEALRTLDIALKLDPTNFEAIFNRGQAKLGLDRTEEAIKDFTTVAAMTNIDKRFSDSAAGYVKLLETAKKKNK